MKNAIGLLLLGLLLQYGSADVSHLSKAGRSQYLPPNNQNLPIEQDYNGIDSHHNQGYLPPNNGHASQNDGYLPPYQNQNQHDHHHHDHHQDYDHDQHDHHHQDQHDHHHHHDHDQDQHDHHHDDHHDHHNDHHDHQHQLHDHHDHHHGSQEYDPNVQVSYHNNFAVHQPHDHSPGQDHDHHDHAHDDHVDIDQQQLEPVNPTSLPFLPVTTRPRVNPSGGAPQRQRQYPIFSSPAPFTRPHGSSSNGYNYSPPSVQAVDTLYPNQVHHSNHDGSTNEHSHSQQGHLHSNNQAQSHSNHGVSNQGYLPPSKSSQVSHDHNSGHLHQEPQQDYLPPNRLNVENSQQGYLPPTQPTHQHSETHSNHGQNEHHHSGHSQQVQNQDYLPPRHSNQQDAQVQNQEYLPPSHSNHQDAQVQNQEYLPPSHSNHQDAHSNPVNHEHSHSGHSQSQETHHSSHSNGGVSSHSGHIHSNHGSSAGLPFLDDHTDFNSVHSNHIHSDPQEDYLPPTQSNLGNLQIPLDPPNPSSALNIVNSPQFGLLHNNEEEEPRSKLTVKGHINVPLPVPQVGYYFLPGVVSRIPSANEALNDGLRPALSIPTIINSQPTASYQQLIPFAPTQQISSPEYTRTFLFQNNNRPVKEKVSEISIVPSIQTQLNQQSAITQQSHPNLGQQIGFSNLPFLPQSLPQQNLNQEQVFLSPDNLQNRGISLQNIARTHSAGQNQFSQSQGLNNFQGAGYLPPTNSHQHHQIQQHVHTSNQAQDHVQHLDHQHRDHDQNHNHHQQNTNSDRGYLPPHNGNQVNPNNQYRSSQFHHPPPNQKGSPPPPATTSAPVISKPSAVLAYAPGRAYKASTNTPFNTISSSSYLPAEENSESSHEDHHHDHHHEHHDHHDHNDNNDNSAVNNQQNESPNRSNTPKDNTVFPLEELLDIQDTDMDLPELMEQLRGRVRTVQIINNHANSVKNIRVLETSDKAGVKTIKILGHSKEDPMGEHKVIHIVSKGPNPEGIRQTVKIFADHKEVSLPTQNAYLPPPKANDSSKLRVSRRSQEAYRSH